MLFNNRAKKEQEQAASNSGAPVQHNIGGSLFAPSLNPRPTRLNLHIETAALPPLQVEEPSLVEEGFRTNPEASFDPASFEPAWLNTQTSSPDASIASPVWTNETEVPQFPAWAAPTEGESSVLSTENVWEPAQEFSFTETTPASPWESTTPQTDIFASHTPGDPANWHETLSELNEPSPEPLGLEVAMPWATGGEAPAFSIPEVSTENVTFQPSAPPFVTESENFNFNAYENAPEAFQAAAPPEHHFLDSVHEQLYPSDVFPTEAFQAQEPKAKVLPPLQPTNTSPDPWTESASQFDEASQYLFPEDSQLTGGAQNWYEQDSSDISKTPGAIYWPEEVLNSDMLELGTSVQDNLNGLQELNNEPRYALPADAEPRLPEFDFPTQSQSELETLSYGAGAGLDFNEGSEQQTPSNFSWTDSPSDWESPGTESSLENTSWVFPSTPESEPSFTLGSNESPDIWNNPLADLSGSSQNDFFATPQPLEIPSSWETSGPSTGYSTPQINQEWTSPLDRETDPSYPINTDSPETNLFEFPSDESLWYGTETTTHFQANDPFMASASTMQSSQLEPPSIKKDAIHYQPTQAPSFVPEASPREFSVAASPSAESNSKLGKLDILGVCPLPDNHRLLVVHNGEVYALMGQNNTHDDSQIAVLHVFERNPLAYQSTFTVIKDTRPDRVGHMIVQAGSIRGQISIEQGKIMWHGETSYI